MKRYIRKVDRAYSLLAAREWDLATLAAKTGDFYRAELKKQSTLGWVSLWAMAVMLFVSVTAIALLPSPLGMVMPILSVIAAHRSGMHNKRERYLMRTYHERQALLFDEATRRSEEAMY